MVWSAAVKKAMIKVLSHQLKNGEESSYNVNGKWNDSENGWTITMSWTNTQWKDFSYSWTIHDGKSQWTLVDEEWNSKDLDLKSLGQGSQSNINAGVVKSYKIPLPSLVEQERIVAILDKFDALVNDLSEGLPAEIEARKWQYEYYRDKLLSFKKIA